jgi:hypothetical protein
MREVVHAFMHRYQTPRRLPPWANEGLAESIAAEQPYALVLEERRPRGVEFVRQGGQIGAVLAMRYADDSWPGPDEIGRAVGYLVVELMTRERPLSWVRWVNAVKFGADWEDALRQEYGMSAADLAAYATQYYTVND